MDELLDTGVDSVPDEPVQEPAVPAEPPVEEVVEEPVTYYSPDGEVVLLSEPPAVSERSVSVGSSITGTPYRSVSPGTYVDFAKDYLARFGYGDDYLLLCSDSNEYVIVWGDLAFSQQRFTGSACSYVRFYSDSSMHGTQMESGTADVSVSPSSFVVYSNLGPYPTLAGDSYVLAQFLCFALVVGVCMYVLHQIFVWSLRSRVSVQYDRS